jgi:hypothetical protein
MSSPRVCYIERADRGVRIRSARLSGMRGDDAWSAPLASSGADGAASERQNAVLLAAWLRDRLLAARGGSSRGAAALDVLCLDADAAACTWTAAPSYERSVVEAVLRQKSSPGLDADGTQVNSIATITTVLGDRAEVGLQALMTGGEAVSGKGETGTGEGDAGGEGKRTRRGGGAKKGAIEGAGVRVPVIAMPDASARVLVDELDRAGVQIGAAMSIWHAIARAWDGRASEGGDAGRVAAESVSTVATVIVDPAGSRVIWCWSRAGSLLAGGSLMMPTPAVEPVDGESPAPVRLGEDQVSRLVSEFLSWSMQTGTAPARVVIVTPELDADVPGTVTAAEFGRALTEAMPGSGVDLAIDADPIGSTLRRVAERADSVPIDGADPRGALVALGGRPSRAHRSMYRWMAGLIAAASVCVTVAGWRLGAAADLFREEARSVRERAREVVAAVRPTVAESPFMREDLEVEVTELRKRAMPPEAMRPAKPVLRELDALSLLLSMPSLTLEEINLGPANGVVTFYVPDTALAQEIETACRDLEGLSIQWKADIRSVEGTGDKRVRCALSGQWGATAGKQVGN